LNRPRLTPGKRSIASGLAAIELAVCRTLGAEVRTAVCSRASPPSPAPNFAMASRLDGRDDRRQAVLALAGEGAHEPGKGSFVVRRTAHPLTPPAVTSNPLSAILLQQPVRSTYLQRDTNLARKLGVLPLIPDMRVRLVEDDGGRADRNDSHGVRAARGVNERSSDNT
jgi:hypothetical protein